jgi:hypothetical protein
MSGLTHRSRGSGLHWLAASTTDEAMTEPVREKKKIADAKKKFLAP